MAYKGLQCFLNAILQLKIYLMSGMHGRFREGLPRIAVSEGRGATLRIMDSNAPCLYKDASGQRCWDAVYKGKGYCKKHLTPYKGSHWGSDLPKNYRVIHAAVLSRDKYICYLCGEGGASAVEHIIPRHLGGSDLMHNLKAIHDKCQRQKTAAEANEAKRQRNTGKRRGFND